jgi:hypothetical protein
VSEICGLFVFDKMTIFSGDQMSAMPITAIQLFASLASSFAWISSGVYLMQGGRQRLAPLICRINVRL